MEIIDDYIIDYDLLGKIQGSTLLYPCSGNDFIPPILQFAPIIDNFWFVDTYYFIHKYNISKYNRNPISYNARHWGNVLAQYKDFKFISKSVKGQPYWDLRDRDIEPCILTLTYFHKPTNRNINIHFRRGYGYSAFDKENLDPFGIFYYRGDSMGEGGSGNLWLRIQKKCRFDMVSSRLIDGGLIVTDGSNPPNGQSGAGYGSKRNAALWQYHWSREKLNIEQILKENRTFHDKFDNLFKCIGYAGERYGPTFIWQKFRYKIGLT